MSKEKRVRSDAKRHIPTTSPGVPLCGAAYTAYEPDDKWLDRDRLPKDICKNCLTRVNRIFNSGDCQWKRDQLDILTWRTRDSTEKIREWLSMEDDAREFERIGAPPVEVQAASEKAPALPPDINDAIRLLVYHLTSALEVVDLFRRNGIDPPAS